MYHSLNRDANFMVILLREAVSDFPVIFITVGTSLVLKNNGKKFQCPKFLLGKIAIIMMLIMTVGGTFT